MHRCFWDRCPDWLQAFLLGLASEQDGVVNSKIEIAIGRGNQDQAQSRRRIFFLLIDKVAPAFYGAANQFGLSRVTTLDIGEVERVE